MTQVHLEFRDVVYYCLHVHVVVEVLLQRFTGCLSNHQEIGVYVVHPQIKFACCTILLFGATCIRTVSSLCADSQAIDRNRWKPSENKGCVSYPYTHCEPFHSNYAYPWMPIAAPELECQQNCPHPQILLQKKVSTSLRVLVVVLGQQTTTQLP